MACGWSTQTRACSLVSKRWRAAVQQAASLAARHRRVGGVGGGGVRPLAFHCWPFQFLRPLHQKKKRNDDDDDPE